MNCPNCGTANEGGGTFCTSCGAEFHNLEAPQPSSAQVPPMSSPGQQYYPVPGQQNYPAPSPTNKPYKAEYVMGLIGSITAIVFLVILYQSGFGYFGYIMGVIVCSILSIPAIILGFIGSSKINKGQGAGGILLTIGGGLGFIGVFFSWATLFYFPLLLAAGIMVLVRRRKIESSIQ